MVVEPRFLARQAFPADLDPRSDQARQRSEAATRDLETICDLPLDEAARTGKYLAIGPLVAKATWPHMIHTHGYEPATFFEDGTSVPDLGVRRIVQPNPASPERQLVTIDLNRRDGRWLAYAYRDTTKAQVQLGAGLPYGENMDFLPGRHFVIDNDQETARYRDLPHEGPLTFTESLQKLTRLIIVALKP